MAVISWVRIPALATKHERAGAGKLEDTTHVHFVFCPLLGGLLLGGLLLLVSVVGTNVNRPVLFGRSSHFCFLCSKWAPASEASISSHMNNDRVCKFTIN